MIVSFIESIYRSYFTNDTLKKSFMRKIESPGFGLFKIDFIFKNKNNI